jgi:aryl-alcohol dehydrogenase-like predicted oxidoreductase
VQNQFSPVFRSSEPELEHCARLGIAFLPWSPLSGIGRAADLELISEELAQAVHG